MNTGPDRCGFCAEPQAYVIDEATGEIEAGVPFTLLRINGVTGWGCSGCAYEAGPDARALKLGLEGLFSAVKDANEQGSRRS